MKFLPLNFEMASMITVISASLKSMRTLPVSSSTSSRPSKVWFEAASRLARARSSFWTACFRSRFRWAFASLGANVANIPLTRVQATNIARIRRCAVALSMKFICLLGSTQDLRQVNSGSSIRSAGIAKFRWRVSHPGRSLNRTWVGTLRVRAGHVQRFRRY